MIPFNCPSCGKARMEPDDCAGHITKCRICKKPTRVPQPAPRPPSRVKPPRERRYWIIKYDLSHYNLEKRFNNWRKSNLDWRVPQHTFEIKKDDIVFLWRSHSDIGIVGAMRVTSEQTERRPDGDEVSDYPDPESDGALLKMRWQPRIEGVLLRRNIYLPKSGLERIPALKDLSAFFPPAGTVYVVTAEQGSILALLAGFNPDTARGEHNEIGSITLQEDNPNGHGKIVFYSDATVSCSDRDLCKSNNYKNAIRMFKDYSCGYHIIDDPTDMMHVAKSFGRLKQVAVDLDTTGPNPHNDNIRCILLKGLDRPSFLIDPSSPVLEQLWPALAGKELVVRSADFVRFLRRRGLINTTIVLTRGFPSVPQDRGPFGAVFIRNLANELNGVPDIPKRVPEEDKDYGGAKWPLA